MSSAAEQQNGHGADGNTEATNAVNSAAMKFLGNVPLPEIPRNLRVRSVLKELTTFKDACALPGRRAAAHACFWAACDKKTMFGNYKAAVMMHLRFDGTIGFPGGLLDEGEELLAGLTRELKEEINYSTEKQRPITYDDYHSTRVLRENGLVLHFFVVRLTLDQFEELERGAVYAKEYGQEVFGTLRVPLYTMANNYSGLPAFLNNRFIGCAKQSLLMALYSNDLLGDQQIEDLVYNANNMKLAPNRM